MTPIKINFNLDWFGFPIFRYSYKERDMTKNMLFTDLQAAKDLNLDISKVHPLDFLSVWYLIKLSIPSLILI